MRLPCLLQRCVSAGAGVALGVGFEYRLITEKNRAGRIESHGPWLPTGCQMNERAAQITAPDQTGRQNERCGRLSPTYPTPATTTILDGGFIAAPTLEPEVVSIVACFEKGPPGLRRTATVISSEVDRRQGSWCGVGEWPPACLRSPWGRHRLAGGGAPCCHHPPAGPYADRRLAPPTAQHRGPLHRAEQPV